VLVNSPYRPLEAPLDDDIAIGYVTKSGDPAPRIPRQIGQADERFLAFTDYDCINTELAQCSARSGGTVWSDCDLDPIRGSKRCQSFLRDPQLRRCAPPKQITGCRRHHGHVRGKPVYPSGNTGCVDPFGLSVENFRCVAATGQQCRGIAVLQ
jgi:hypothetical protein